MAQVVALVDDLFFQAKMLETARHIGIELKTFVTGEALVAEIARENPRLVIVDLNARQAPFEAIERVKASASTAPILGFFSHVQIELAERAQAAGCREVMPRSKFTRDLTTILAQAKS